MKETTMSKAATLLTISIVDVVVAVITLTALPDRIRSAGSVLIGATLFGIGMLTQLALIGMVINDSRLDPGDARYDG